MSAATASQYVQQMVKLETVTTSTKEAALRKLARDYGMTVSQLTHLYKAKAKTCDVSLFARVRSAYLDRCAKMAARLLHTIEIEEALGTNAHDEDLADRLAALLAEAVAQGATVNEGKRLNARH